MDAAETFDKRLCRNKDGEIVLRVAIWHPPGARRTELSVHGYFGIKSKRSVRLTHAIARLDQTRAEMEVQVHNMAYLWAMQWGFANFTVIDRQPRDFKDLYHPTELTKENQS